MYETIESIFNIGVKYAILITDFIGVAVLLWTVIACTVKLLRGDRQRIRIALAEGIALSLEFKIGGELLRTVIVREWNEMLVLGAIIALRAILAFLIHWEIEVEKKRAEDIPGSENQDKDK